MKDFVLADGLDAGTRPPVSDLDALEAGTLVSKIHILKSFLTSKKK